MGGHQPSVREPHDSFLYIYWNGPEGLSESRRTLLPASAVNALAVADFDGDGRLDIFACSYHAGLERDVDSFLYWNREGRGFSASDRQRLFTPLRLGVRGRRLRWRWPHVDLAIAYHKVEGRHVGDSAVWWNGGEGFDAKRVTRLPTRGPHGMTAIEPGNQADRGPDEHYESEPFELPPGTRARRIDWEAEVPATCRVRAQVRAAPTREALGRAAWRGRGGGAAGSSAATGSTRGRAAGCSTGWPSAPATAAGHPRVTQVRVTWQ